MTQDEMLVSVRLHCQAVKKRADYDELAHLVGFDVERAAQAVVGAALGVDSLL